jgi:16S rRNA (guanine(966)-N(2))-methyltransferase RsmD
MPRPKRTPEKNSSDPTSSTGEVRIIGGSLRRRRLVYSGDPRTRPMKDRVREAIFNLLGDITGTTAIDLFAGTGALGLEAISRGAAQAFLIEKHFPSADLISKNIATLDIASQCHVHGGDTFIWAKRLPELGASPWLVFCSPPYAFYVDRPAEMKWLLQTLTNAAPAESCFVVEGDEHTNLEDLPREIEWHVHRYPPAVVAIGDRRA